PLGGITRERQQDRLLEARGDVGPELPKRLRVAHDLRPHRRHAVPLFEGDPAGQHLVEDHTEAVEVAARVTASALHLLGRHIIRGAGRPGQTRPRHLAQRGVERDPEIDDLDAGPGRHDHVLRLEITVNDAFAMQIVERVGDLHGNVDGSIDGQNAVATNDAAQRFTLDELLYEIDPALLLGPTDADDRRVVEPNPDFLLTQEA